MIRSIFKRNAAVRIVACMRRKGLCVFEVQTVEDGKQGGVARDHRELRQQIAVHLLTLVQLRSIPREVLQAEGITRGGGELDHSGRLVLPGGKDRRKHTQQETRHRTQQDDAFAATNHIEEVPEMQVAVRHNDRRPDASCNIGRRACRSKACIRCHSSIVPFHRVVAAGRNKLTLLRRAGRASLSRCHTSSVSSLPEM